MAQKTGEKTASSRQEASPAAKPSRPPNPFIEMMAASAGAGDPDVFAHEFAQQKNAEYAEAFARVPYEKRLLLIPQCLRSSLHCKAKEVGVSYECARCGACFIPEILDAAEALGYMGPYILKGGRAVIELIERIKPQAIAGVACPYEGLMGIMECERRGIPVQFIPLSKDGCADTEVDLETLKTALARLKSDDDDATGNGTGR